MTTRGKRLIFILIVLLLASGAVVYSLFFSNLFLINKVTVAGLGRINETELLQLADIELNTPLINLDSVAVASQISSLKTINTVEVRRGWPNTVAIVVSERVPIALTDLADGRYLVDEAGIAFTRAGPNDVYRFVTAPNNSARGLAARVARILPEWLIGEVALVESVNGVSATVILNSGRRINWGDELKPVDKAAVLRVLLRTAAGDIDVSTPEVPVINVPIEN